MSSHVQTSSPPGLVELVSLIAVTHRYTITYTPAADPILPIPSDLYVRVRNTSAIPLRAAYLHGPYTLYAACYPAQFDPNTKFEKQGIEGFPQYEPYLKAGGGWDATIKVPSDLLEAHKFGSPGQGGPTSGQRVTWIVEIQSQVIFSSSAAVHFELLVSRDEKSLGFFSGGAWSSGNGPPGNLLDHWEPDTKGKQVLALKGVYSKSITAHVDDTSSLWNTPSFPSVKDASTITEPGGTDTKPIVETSKSAENSDTSAKKAKKKKVHLVLLTHGLHSNLGADMLYLKESIDAATRNSHKNAHHTNTPHVDPIGPENSRYALFARVAVLAQIQSCILLNPLSTVLLMEVRTARRVVTLKKKKKKKKKKRKSS